MDKQVITKIQRLEDKDKNTWGEFELGAEASNIYVRNGNGTGATAQSLLLDEMPPIQYDYGQDIWDANSNVIEQLTWENIQKWLDEGRIKDFLKEGDCIRININKPAGPFSDIWHLYVIGINTHNGQTDNSLQHIDFCGGTATTLRYYAAGGTVPASPQTFLGAESNNGLPLEDGYGNFFVDNPFIKPKVDSGDVINFGEDTESTLVSFLRMEENYLKDKTLYLDCRPAPKCEVIQNLVDTGVIQDLDNISVTAATVSQALSIFAEAYDRIQEDKQQLYQIPMRIEAGEYQILAYYWHKIMTSSSIYAPVALAVLRYSVDLDIDEFLDYVDDNTESIRNSLIQLWKTSTTAYEFLRYSISLDIIPPSANRITQENVVITNDFRNLIAKCLNDSVYLEYETDHWEERTLTEQEEQALATNHYSINSLKLLNLFESLCEGAKKWNGIAAISKSFQRQKDQMPSCKIWGLTEKELFGECTYSNPEYAQGQIFQYPIFQDMAMRRNITSDLSSRNDQNTTIRMITINPAEDSTTDAVGMDIETLMPTKYSVITVKQDSGLNKSYPIDMPICFRMETYVPVTMQDLPDEPIST